MKKITIALAVGLLSVGHIKAQDFVYEGIAYNIIGEGQVEVTSLPDGQKYSGNVSVPGVIVFGDTPDIPSTKAVKVSSAEGNDSGDERTVYNVVKIGDSAFKDCISLVNLEMPTVIEEIGVQAIAGCTSLAEITMPYALRRIDDEAFMGSSFKTMYVRAGLKEIGDRVFYGVIADNIMMKACELTEFGEETFANSSIKRISLPSELKSIPENTFKGCGSLEFVQLNASLEEIGKNAFADCSNLEALTLPQSLRIIDEGAFTGTALNAIAFNTTEAPEYSAQSVFGEHIPALVTITSDAVGEFKEWCPQLTEGKVKFHVLPDYYPEYWAYIGEFRVEDANMITSKGVATDYNVASDIFINEGEDLTLAFPLLSGGPEVEFLANGEKKEFEFIFADLDFFFLNNVTSILGSALLLEFSNVTEDCEISYEFSGSGVKGLEESDSSLRYMPVEKMVACDNEAIYVYDSAGRLLLTGFNTLNLDELTNGLYIIKTSKESKKISVR